MDQAGSYGYSNIPGSAPDLALSFGDTEYNKLTGTTLNVDIFGPAWQWQNNKAAYGLFNGAGEMPVGSFDHYEFVWSNDYEFCQIYPHMKTPMGSTRVPTSIASFSMTRQHPKAGECPPQANASPVDRAKCAMWKRESQFFSIVPGITNITGNFVYYAFQIVDQKGKPIQPYYDAYLQYYDDL